MPTLALLLTPALTLHAAPAGGDGALPAGARAVLARHCYRCHGQDGKAVAGVFVLQRERLLARKKLVPGNAARSRLVASMADGEMPPPEEKSRPGAAEIDLVRRWVQAGAPDFAAPAPARAFLDDRAVLAAVEADLAKASPRDRRFLRYLTLTHLYNAGVSDDELENHRRGLSKLLNSLSWGREIVRPRPIDPARTAFRIDLRDFDWDAGTWQTILARYPYGLVSDGPAARRVQAFTGAALPHVRGDWFVFAASRPPLYHDVLGIPASDRELERRLEIDVAANIRRDRVARAGFNDSGVSRNNRLIERHRSRHGAYWKSYDFAGNDGRRNLFEHPLGPSGARVFEHDGGEIIFSLPNGLQGYMLVDAGGRRLDVAPVKVVSTREPGRPEVVNGVACMRCHSRGMIVKDDQVRRAVLAGGGFSAEEKDTVRALYPVKEEFDRLLREDAERFRRAVEKAGDGVEKTDTVALLAERFEEDLDLKRAAAELGLRPAELLRGLGKSARLGRALAPLRVGGAVKRDTFVGAFAAAAADLDLGEVLPAGAAVLAAGRGITNSIGMRLVRVPAGKFTRGSPAGEAHRERHEGPAQEVEITRPFLMGAHEVTQAEFRKVMGGNPSWFSPGGEGKGRVTGLDAGRLPVESVAWEEAAAFCRRLSELPEEKKAGRAYRLPTEAEWEYACRAGSATPFHRGSSLSSAHANFDGRYPYGGAEKSVFLRRPSPVGSYKPNAWGLFDMHGNVAEWCADWFDEGAYRGGPARDPRGPARGVSRVRRGGSWHDGGDGCRSAARAFAEPGSRDDTAGFRVVCVPAEAP
jgi:formylglycine-generating enzyme required for sulfatase activity/mono/diheme cytochrome c family protein